MGCFGGGSQESTSVSKVELPAWLDEAAQYNIEQAQTLAEQPYETYDAARIAPFSGDQLASFDFLRGGAGSFLQPTGITEQIGAASTAPVQQYSNPTLLDDIPGANGQSYGLDDYINPYISNVLQNTLREFNRQGEADRQDINRSSTMAGAFGDAGHGIQLAEQRRNQERARGDILDSGYADAYNQALGAKNLDLNRLLQGFQTNAGLYEGGLQRAIQGGQAEAGVGSQEQTDFLQYINALNASGQQQQGQAQASAELGYQDFLRQQGYPAELLNILNATTSIQPHGQTTTTTTETPTASPFSSVLSAGLGIGSLFI